MIERDELETVRDLLDRLAQHGLEWFRRAVPDDVAYLKPATDDGHRYLEPSEIVRSFLTSPGEFPKKGVALMQPDKRHANSVIGLWVRWDTSGEQHSFRLFLGQWLADEEPSTFIAYRFETPEQGDKHDFFHCQPCRNFGDGEVLRSAVRVSEHFPTIPIQARDIVELVVCAMMALLGRTRTDQFLRKLIRDDMAFAGRDRLRDVRKFLLRAA